jgi:hypothetical protein
VLFGLARGIVETLVDGRLEIDLGVHVLVFVVEF